MSKHSLPVYLDCNATSPIEPAVATLVLRFTNEEYGNAGSRTHEYGTRAKQAVQQARDQIATALRVERDEVIFTSGATESNNLALLGLAPHGEQYQRRHIITGAVEHKAVLEPIEALQQRGFRVTILPPTSGGFIDPDELRRALLPDTVVVSLMHVNNETGVEQPLGEYCRVLEDHDAYFHVDAAQGFGKKNEPLRNGRVDLISISGHKIYAPKGIGALISRRRGSQRPPIRPLAFGGGQEWGLRPGTLPVPLIVGFGLAAELANKNSTNHAATCQAFREHALAALAPLGVEFNGDQDRVLPHTLNIAVSGLDAEAFMLATKSLISISNGSACTSHSYQPSHVLKAMGLSSQRIQSSLRFSWCHLTPDVDWTAVVSAVQGMR
jgi:cysteine desulfurase